MFAVSDNIRKMLYTESVRKVHKKESHMHDSRNTFITATIKECKYAFQFLKEEMEPIRMSSHIAAGIICNGESQEQKVITRGGNQERKESTIISGVSLLHDYVITPPKHQPRQHVVSTPK
jgi:hypothetical protein